MERTQQIKEAHPWLRYDEVVKVILYHHQGSMWIQNLEIVKIERQMEALTKLIKSKSMKAPLTPLQSTFKAPTTAAQISMVIRKK